MEVWRHVAISARAVEHLELVYVDSMLIVFGKCMKRYQRGGSKGSIGERIGHLSIRLVISILTSMNIIICLSVTNTQPSGMIYLATVHHRREWKY